jgi:hypothetical protein
VEPTSSQDAKALVQELETTIQQTLAESSRIAGCLARIRAEGYDVSLVLEATIGFHRRAEPDERDDQQPDVFDFRVASAQPDPLRMTPLDKKFLRSLKISVEDDE